MIRIGVIQGLAYGRSTGIIFKCRIELVQVPVGIADEHEGSCLFFRIAQLFKDFDGFTKVGNGLIFHTKVVVEQADGQFGIGYQAFGSKDFCLAKRFPGQGPGPPQYYHWLSPRPIAV